MSRVLTRLSKLCPPRAGFPAAPPCTAFSSASTSTSSVFDRQLKVAHRDRAAFARAGESVPEPLAAEVTSRLLDRLEDCKRTFPVAVTFGGAAQHVAEQLGNGRSGVERLYHLDTSPAMLRHAQGAAEQAQSRGIRLPHTVYALADEEFLPLQEASVDVIISSMGLHWVNDLPGVMAQCRRALKPDGLFLAAFLGGQTLQEFRIACSVAEMEREGGISVRMSPLAQMRDAGSLLGVGGFALPSVDTDDIEMKYSNVLDLVEHLRLMGEANAVQHRRPVLHRNTALAGAAVYHSFEDVDDAEPGETGITATYQIVYMAGWAPDPSQQKPAARGSATSSFGDLDKAIAEIGEVHDVGDIVKGKSDEEDDRK